MSDSSTHSSTDSSPSTHSASEEANGSVPSEILLQRFVVPRLDEPQPIPEEQHDIYGGINITYLVTGVILILILAYIASLDSYSYRSASKHRNAASIYIYDISVIKLYLN